MSAALPAARRAAADRARGPDAPCAADRGQRRLDAAAGDRLRGRLRGGADRGRSARTHSPLRGRGRGRASSAGRARDRGEGAGLVARRSFAGGAGASARGSRPCRRRRDCVERARSLHRVRAKGTAACRTSCSWATISINRPFATACEVWSRRSRPRDGRCARSAFRAAVTGCGPGSGARCCAGRDVVVLHQIKLSALEARLFAALTPAARFRRRRCHLRAQAAPARRTGRRFDDGGAGNSRPPAAAVDVVAAGNDVLAARRTARRPRDRDTADLDRRRLLSAGRGRRGRGPDHRLDRQPRKPDLPGDDPSRPRAADGAPSRAQGAG